MPYDPSTSSRRIPFKVLSHIVASCPSGRPSKQDRSVFEFDAFADPFRSTDDLKKSDHRARLR